MRVRSIFELTVPICVLVLGLASSPAQYIARNVVFLNSGNYPSADLSSLAAVKQGDAVSKQSLLAAVARLQATGYFSDVEATLDGPIKAVEVRFKLKPVDPAQLLPVAFDNLVWFTPDEIAAFRKSVPLLSFGIPEAGDQRTRVQTALEQMLVRHAVKATIGQQISDPTPFYPARTCEYRVEMPAVQLGPTHLAGISPDMAPAMRSALAQAQRQPYNEGAAGTLTADILLAPYFNAGNIDARLIDVTRSVAASDAQSVKVDFSATVDVGQTYRIGTITYTPAALVPADTFAKTLKLHPGDPASRKLLDASLKPVTQVYRDHAYLDAFVSLGTMPNLSTHVVDYSVAVIPGDPYRLNAVTVNNLPANLRPDFDRAFPLRKGDLYNESAVGTFLLRHPEIQSLAGYTAGFTASADPNTHTVDLVVEFTSLSITVH